MLVQMKQCLTNFKQRLGAVGLRWASNGAPKSYVLGVELVDLTRDASGAAAMQVTTEVLHLIGAVSPRELRRLAALSPRIAIVRGYQWAGQYWHFYRGIALEASVVERQVPVAIAMTIVHESTHGRISAVGVPYLPHQRRIEEICVRQEIRFAALIPGTDTLIDGARRKLAIQI